MAFYSHMMKEYSLTSNPHRLPRQQRLDNVKSTIEKTYASSIEASEEVKERIRFSTAALSPERGNIVAQYQTAIINEKIQEDQTALDYISSLTTKDYFDALAKKEEVELGEYIDNCFEKMGQATESIIKLENKQGLAAKFYSLTGKSGEKIEQASAQFETANSEVVNAQEALTEWQNMQSKDKTDYLLERFEHEGIVSLDTEKLAAYIPEKDALLQPVSTEDNAQ